MRRLRQQQGGGRRGREPWHQAGGGGWGLRCLASGRSMAVWSSSQGMAVHSQGGGVRADKEGTGSRQAGCRSMAVVRLTEAGTRGAPTQHNPLAAPARPPATPESCHGESVSWPHLNRPLRSSTDAMGSSGRRLTRLAPSAEYQRMYSDTSYSHKPSWQAGGSAAAPALRPCNHQVATGK